MRESALQIDGGGRIIVGWWTLDVIVAVAGIAVRAVATTGSEADRAAMAVVKGLAAAVRLSMSVLRHVEIERGRDAVMLGVD